MMFLPQLVIFIWEAFDLVVVLLNLFLVCINLLLIFQLFRAEVINFTILISQGFILLGDVIKQNLKISQHNRIGTVKHVSILCEPNRVILYLKCLIMQPTYLIKLIIVILLQWSDSIGLIMKVPLIALNKVLSSLQVILQLLNLSIQSLKFRSYLITSLLLLLLYLHKFIHLLLLMIIMFKW